MNTVNLTLELHTLAGSWVDNVADSLLHIAKTLNIMAYTDFNGVQLFARSWDTKADILLRYDREVLRRQGGKNG